MWENDESILHENDAAQVLYEICAGSGMHGSDIKEGLIEDTFSQVVVEKVSEFPSEVKAIEKVGDEKDYITESILREIREGADVVFCTGGMSVDPDDCTPGAICATGAEIVTYGAPVLPGAMLCVAYYHNDEKIVPVIGLPGCVMYSKRTVFDLVLPLIMADDPITSAEIAALGEGGLCLGCKVCTFPNCGFGK